MAGGNHEPYRAQLASTYLHASASKYLQQYHNLTISQSLSFLSYIELCHRSPLATIPSMINTTSNKRSHAVTFSICSDLYIVPASEQDRSTTWYTSEDKQVRQKSGVHTSMPYYPNRDFRNYKAYVISTEYQAFQRRDLIGQWREHGSLRQATLPCL